MATVSTMSMVAGCVNSRLGDLTAHRAGLAWVGSGDASYGGNVLLTPR